MIKNYIIYKNKKIIKSKQLEQYEVVSENSSTKEFLLSFEKSMIKILSEKFKDFDYQLFGVFDENIGIKPLNIVVMLDSEEKIEYIKQQIDRITDVDMIKSKIVFDIIKKESFEKTTNNKILTEEWANSVRKYLANEFDFRGKIRLETSFYDSELQSFWLSASGKGVNDDIVWVLKEMSKAITLSKNFGFYTKDKYSFINGYFQR